MSPKQRLPLVLIFVVGIVSLPMILFSGNDPSPELLAARIAASAPGWNSYQEDIKGQIGASPVAEWSGRLVTAAQGDDLLSLSFVLEEPWKTRDGALPVLIRLPDGATLMPRDAIIDGEHRVYRYALPSSAPLPWAEVQYPHHRERLYFDATGQWMAKD